MPGAALQHSCLAAIVVGKTSRRRGGLFVMIYLASRHLPGLWALSRCSHGPGRREQSLVARPLSQLSLKREMCDGREADKAESSGFCGETLIIFQSAKKKSGCALPWLFTSNTTTHSHNCFLPRIHRCTSKHTACRTLCSSALSGLLQIALHTTAIIKVSTS